MVRTCSERKVAFHCSGLSSRRTAGTWMMNCKAEPMTEPTARATARRGSAVAAVMPWLKRRRPCHTSVAIMDRFQMTGAA